MKHQIFISYRRQGADVTAKLICETLKNKGYSVFYDYDSLRGGTFDNKILSAIDECSDVVLVLPKNGLNRCKNKKDWVRQEIERALKTNKNIIPVMLDDFDFPKNLPEEIKDVARYNGIRFHMDLFEAVIEKILEKLSCKNSVNTPVASENLEFELVKNGYKVSGIGSCKDTRIIIPKEYQGKAVTTIGSYAFSLCDFIESVTFPDSITTIEDNAFQYCKNISDIVIPYSVTQIGKKAFSLKALNSITIDPNNKHFCSVDGHLYSKDMKTIVRYIPQCENHKFVIPTSVTKIASGAFDYAKFLEKIDIHDHVADIGKSAFSECENLQEVKIPNGISIINESTFVDCLSLKSVVLPDSVTEIRNHAFSHCRALEYIKIPKNVTAIGNYVFDCCLSIKKFDVDVDNQHFCSCNSHLYSKDKTILIQYAGANTETDFTVPDSVTTIAKNAFDSCKFIQNITIQSNTTSIENSAFSGCSSLKKITLPNGPLQIGEWIFDSCYNLEQITIPNGVTVIKNMTFHLCRVLNNVVIPTSVTRIERNAFCVCDSLSYIRYEGTKEMWFKISLHKNAFSSCDSLRVIDCSDGVINFISTK